MMPINEDYELQERSTIDKEVLAALTPLDFRTYQKAAYKTIKPHTSLEMEKADWALGLGGEAGEVQELIKHDIMHRHGMDLVKLSKEISDVLWYCAAIASSYNLRLDVIAEMNLAKLDHRHGEVYNCNSSADRHEIEKEFEHTEQYRELLTRLRSTIFGRGNPNGADSNI